MTQETSNIIINPRAAKENFWLPLPREVFIGYGNSSYLNSLWLGTVHNATSVLYRIVAHIAWPLFNFRFFTVIVNLVAMPVYTLLLLVMGVLGNVRAVRLPDGILDHKDTIVLTPLDSKVAMLVGVDEPICHVVGVGD